MIPKLRQDAKRQDFILNNMHQQYKIFVKGTLHQQRLNARSVFKVCFPGYVNTEAICNQ